MEDTEQPEAREYDMTDKVRCSLKILKIRKLGGLDISSL